MAHLCFLLFLNFWLQIKAQGFGINLIKIPEDDQAQIVCTTALVEKYFHSGEDLSGYVIHMTITNAPTHLQTSLLKALHADPNYFWTIVVETSQSQDNNEANIKHVLHEKPQCYFLVIENVENENLDEIFESWKTNLNWNPLAQFVVYFSSVEETEDEMTDIMIEILLNFMNKKIYNVNIIGQSEEISFFMSKTVFPYHPDNNCGNRVISIETLDVCDYQESEREKYEVGKVKNEEEIDIDIGEIDDKEEFQINENEQEMCLHNRSNESEIEVNFGDNEKLIVCSEHEKQKDMKTYNIFNTLPFKKRSPINPQKFQNFTFQYKTVETLTNDSATQNVYPQLFIKELYRALFLDKFPKDLSGCPLVAAFRPWEPYIFNEVLENSFLLSPTESERNRKIPSNNSYGEEDQLAEDYITNYNKQDTEETVSEFHLNGIEFKMIQTIAERLHISIEMQVENKNLYHLFQQLIDGNIEMVVGGIDEDPRISQFVSSTIPYHQDDLTWCVAKAQSTRNLFNFLETFQFSAWLLTLIFILTASWIISITKRYLKIRLSFLKSYFRINIYVMGIILGQSIGLKPMPTSLKVCFGTLFYMGFMFGNIYQSFVISTLTTPKISYQISHLNEIYQNRMHIRGSVENVRHLNKEGEIYRYVREQFQMCYNIEECLQLAAKDTNLAVVVSRQHFFYNPRIPRNKLYCFDRNENIYVYFVTMLMPKKFHLLHKINPVIQHIIESGHMQKWARELDRRRKISEEIQHAREDQLKSLTLTQVAGSFVFNGVSLAFALWMFVMECAIYWLVVKRRTRLKFLKYMHKKFI